MKKKLRKYQFGSQGLASTPTNPYTGFSPSISLQGPSSGLGMSKPLDYENDKPKTQLAPSSSLLNKPSLSPAPTSTPYTGISSKPIVSPAFTSTPSIASPQRYASASVKPEAGAPKTAFGATKTGLNQTKLQSATLTAPPPKTNVGSTAAAGVTAGLNMIGQGVETYRGYNPVAPGPTSLYNKREQGMLKKINKERDAVTALSTTAGALGTAAGITAAIPVIGWGVGAGLGIAAAGTGVAAASTAASLDKQETNLGKRVNSRIEREKREAEGLRKTQEIESMVNSSNPLDIQNEMMSIEGGTSEETRPGFNAENFQKAIEGAVGFDREEVPLEYKYGGKMPKKQLGTYSKPSYALQYDTIPYVGTMKGPQLYNDPFADKKRYPVPNDVKFDTRDTLLGMRDRGMPLPKNAEYELGEELDPNFVGPSGRIPTTVDPKKMKAPNKYKMGGLRSYQEPNAELERGEVTQHPNGKVEIEGGKRHEEGGNEKYVPPGAFIWSDHLKYQGKSMAQWFLMFKDNPERVEQLKTLQENLASKEKPSKYNDLPKQKYGGELPKYQAGTPAAPAPIGVNSKAKTWFNEYGEYILPAASAVGQIVNLALAKDPYEDMKVPAAKRVESSQQISLARTNAQAEMDANEAGAADARRSALYTGSGPGSTAIYQTIANQQAGLNSKAQNEANRINMSIAAEEARLNSEDKYRRESFNAGAENETAKLKYDKNVNQAAYKAATTASYGNVFAGIANDAQSFMRDKAVARSITRGTNIDRNRYAMNLEAIEKAARDEETINANKAKRDFSEDEYLKLYTKKIGEINTYLSKRD